MAGWASSIVCWKRIHLARSPVSPSGMRRRNWPTSRLSRPNTSALLSSGMLPTKWSRSRLSHMQAPRLASPTLAISRQERRAKAHGRPEQHVFDARMLPSPLEAVDAGDRIGRNDKDGGGQQGADPRVEPRDQAEAGDQLQERRQDDEEGGRAEADLVEQLRRLPDVGELGNRVRKQERAADQADRGLGVDGDAGKG